jgi:hypothetical protein
MGTCSPFLTEGTIVSPGGAGKLETERPKSVLPCRECVRLLEKFGDAVRDVLTLNETHFLAVIDGDPDPHRFDILLHIANERKQDAKYAYLQHQECHDKPEATQDEAHANRT